MEYGRKKERIEIFKTCGARHLSKGLFDSKFLWSYSKPYIQELTQSKEMVVLSFNDSIEDKQYTDNSELVCWHYDHVFKRSVKGVNFLTADG